MRLHDAALIRLDGEREAKIKHLESENVRLRITDAEREAIELASLVLRNTAEELDQHGDYPRRLNEAAALMLNLLQRLK